MFVCGGRACVGTAPFVQAPGWAKKEKKKTKNMTSSSRSILATAAALLSALLAFSGLVSVRGLVERETFPLFREVHTSSKRVDGSRLSGSRLSGSSRSGFGDESSCDMCKQVVMDIEDRLNDPALQDSVVEFLLDSVCPLLPEDASRTCRQEARVVVAQIAASIQQMIDVDEICVGLGACGETPPPRTITNGLPEAMATGGDAQGSDSALEGAHAMQPTQSMQSMQSPWYCHGLDCPYFTVLEKGKKFEKRRYVGGTWASTTIETYLYAMAAPRGFKRLFNYIDEGNFLGVKIPMTSPVRVRMEPSCGAFCKQNFTVSFFMPKEYQSDPPPPLDRDVFIEKDPPATYYVKSSGGFKIDDLSIAHMANALAQDLDEAGRRYEASEWFVAGYDPPFRISDRHTEVWIKEKVKTAFGKVGDVETCDLCENVVNEVTEVVEDPEAQARAISYAKEACATIGSSLRGPCEEMVDEFGPLLIDSLVEALVSGEDMCVQAGYCS